MKYNLAHLSKNLLDLDETDQSEIDQTIVTLKTKKEDSKASNQSLSNDLDNSNINIIKNSKENISYDNHENPTDSFKLNNLNKELNMEIQKTVFKEIGFGLKIHHKQIPIKSRIRHQSVT